MGKDTYSITYTISHSLDPHFQKDICSGGNARAGHGQTVQTCSNPNLF